MATAFELIDFGARIISSDGGGGRAEKNRSIVEVNFLRGDSLRTSRRFHVL